MQDPSISYTDILSALLGSTDSSDRADDRLDVQVWRGETDGSVGMTLTGIVDVATVPGLARTLATATPAGTQLITLDINGLTHLGACGLGVLVALRRRMLTRGDDLEVAYSAGGLSHRTMSMTNLDRVFPPLAAA